LGSLGALGGAPIHHGDAEARSDCGHLFTKMDRMNRIGCG
jgi:hypothetical protein